MPTSLFDQSTDPATYRRRLAALLLEKGTDVSPVQHWTQGAARLANALSGGMMLRGEEEEQKKKDAAFRKELQNLPGLGSADAGTTAAPAATPTAELNDPTRRMAAISAAGETGMPDFSKQGQVARDTGGSKSYGVFGLNTWAPGGNPNNTSMGRFVAEYGPALGLTAPVGSPDLDAQWKSVAQTNPEGLQAAQLDWYQKNVAAGVEPKLTAAGVPQSMATDPRVQGYFADRVVQQGPASIEKHKARLVQALAGAGGDPAAFLRGVSGADRAAIPGDFRSYLATNPANVPGLQNRIARREQMALGLGADGGAPQTTGYAPTEPPRVQMAGLPPQITGGAAGVSAGLPMGGGGPPAPQALPQQPPTQLAQAGGQVPMRPQPAIPPDVGQRIRQLLGSSDRRMQALGMQLYQQYAKPVEYETKEVGGKLYRIPKLGAGAPTDITPPVKIPPGSEIPPVPPGADPAQHVKLWSEHLSKRGLPPSEEDQSKMRAEIRQLPSYKNLAEAAPIYKNMFDTAGRTDKYSDLNLVYGLSKIFDPGSVVREGEQILVRNAASLPEWLKGQISAINGGAALTPDSRAAILREAHTRMSSYKGVYDTETQTHRRIAKRRGMDPEDIIPDLGTFEPWTPPKQEQSEFTDEQLKAEAERRAREGRR